MSKGSGGNPPQTPSTDAITTNANTFEELVKNGLESVTEEQIRNACSGENAHPLLQFWISMNTKRYEKTSEHIHFTLNKIHDSIKLFFQLYLGLMALAVTILSGKFGRWLTGEQIVNVKDAVGLLLIGLVITFAIYIAVWAFKHASFRRLEYENFKSFLKGYTPPGSGYKIFLPIAAFALMIFPAVLAWQGLEILVDETRLEPIPGELCTGEYYDCFLGGENKTVCQHSLKMCLAEATSELDKVLSKKQNLER